VVCVLRLHPCDLESESSERLARVCEALAQTFSTLGDGWGTWINVISRARRQYLERSALWHPTMAIALDTLDSVKLRPETSTGRVRPTVQVVTPPEPVGSSDHAQRQHQEPRMRI
jgi:hypothetical protein